MAPQQNSTLIDDNLEIVPSLLNIPGEMGRCSPILPPQSNLNYNCKSRCNNKDTCISNNHNNGGNNCAYETRRRQRPKNDNRPGSSHGGRSHRSRSISLYGVNSTVEQGQKEIPIWLEDEPRYVSGVTNKTTCNDIIKAVIDDELRNGNFAYCKKTQDGAASRDYSDYVITEAWRGIERSYDGNMAILPVWKAWSRVHNELRLSLKHRSQIQDPPHHRQPQSVLTALRKYLTKLLRFSRSSKTKEKNTAERQSTKYLAPPPDRIPDEYFFVLMPDKDAPHEPKADHPEVEKNKNFTPTAEESAKQAKAKLLKDKLHRLSDTRASARKRRATSKRTVAKDRRAHERRRSTSDANSCVKRRKDVPHRHSIRNQLARKTGEVDELYNREYELTRRLTHKFKLYKLQNELYMEPERQLELSVGQIQRNIERYAQEIVKTEHELLQVKNEIKQDISIINNLKRMSLESSGNGNRAPLTTQAPSLANDAAAAAAKENENQMQFVDNIYEFCDNNASMLV